LLNQEEKVIPITSVAETSKDLIVLRDDVDDLTIFPPFEERHIVEDDSGGDQIPSASAGISPPVVTGYPLTGSVPVMPSPEEQCVTRVEQNIPEGTVAMKEGAKVISSEGKHVGNVERVIVDSSVDQITHLLISRGLLMKESKLIPMKWVMSLGEDKVHL